MNYYIDNVKVGLTEGGVSMCGPVDPSVVVSVQFHCEDGNQYWFHCVEFDGMPSFYITEEDMFDKLIEEDEGFYDWLNRCCAINRFEDIRLSGEYDEIFERMDRMAGHPAIPFLRYVIALVRCGMGEVKELTKMGIGKDAAAINVPISDVEEDYREEHE